MEAKILVLITVVVIVSGCTALNGEDNNEAEFEEPESIGQGLEIVSLEPSDPRIFPGQRAVVILRMRNHHISEINIDEMVLYNLGPLELVDSGQSWQDRCTPSEIPAAEHDQSPLIECEWRISAPENMEDFESKTISPRLQLRYDSVLSNKQHPLEVQFKHYTDISDPSQVERAYSNEEVRMDAEIENPAAVDGTRIGLSFDNVGSGRVVPLSEDEEAKTFYEVEVSPESVFSDCSPSFEVRSAVGPEIEESCGVHAPGGEAVARNLIFATSYKYQQSQSVDIEVVNDQ